ncbi:hypothetical protein PC128_g12687 [Phytophthora cactorum]|nr:hypothetical protein PC128_g12687 [Phytophthora cactorum]
MAGGPSAKAPDVKWNKDGRPINWIGQDWPLCMRQMMCYLDRVEVKDGNIPFGDICDGSVTIMTWTTIYES